MLSLGAKSSQGSLTKMIDTFIGWSILLSVTLYMPDVTLAKFSVVYFQFFGFAFLTICCFTPRERKMTQKEVASSAYLFLLASLINVVAFKFNILPVACTFNLAMAIAIIMSMAVHIQDADKIKKFIVWAAVINCFYLGVQKLGWNPIINSEITTGEEGGLMGNAANLSMLLAIMLPFVVKRTWIAWPLFFVIGIIQHESMLVLVCLAYLVIKNQYMMVPALLGLFALFLFRGKEILESSLGGRIDIWRCTIEQTFQSPYFGWGLGNKPAVTSVMHHVVEKRPDYVYSSYLQFLFSTGAAGLIALFYTLKTFFKNVTRSEESLAVISILILSIAKYPIESHRLWVLMCACIALWMIRFQQKREVAHAGTV